MVTFVLFESAPFIALAFAARHLGRWLTLGCVLAFVGVFIEVDREVSESTSSTAALAFIVVPFVLLALLLVVLVVNEIVRLVARRQRGGTIRRPSRRDLLLALTSMVIGLLVLSWVGAVAGLALAFVVWSVRSSATIL